MPAGGFLGLPKAFEADNAPVGAFWGLSWSSQLHLPAFEEVSGYIQTLTGKGSEWELNAVSGHSRGRDNTAAHGIIYDEDS